MNIAKDCQWENQNHVKNSQKYPNALSNAMEIAISNFELLVLKPKQLLLGARSYDVSWSGHNCDIGVTRRKEIADIVDKLLITKELQISIV